LIQAQELAKIPLLIARIEVLERELERYKTRKDSNYSSLPPSKDENRPTRTSSLPFEFFGRRQVIDIPVIKQIVIEHRVYKCICTCGKVVESDFPVDVDSPVKYGKSIESLVGYLNVRQYLPFKRLQEILNDIFANQISEGGLHCLLKRLASKGVDDYEMIRQNVLRAVELLAQTKRV
jgi:transposase